MMETANSVVTTKDVVYLRRLMLALDNWTVTTSLVRLAIATYLARMKRRG